jgi:hypothetical protein
LNTNPLASGLRHVRTPIRDPSQVLFSRTLGYAMSLIDYAARCSESQLHCPGVLASYSDSFKQGPLNQRQRDSRAQRQFAMRIWRGRLSVGPVVQNSGPGRQIDTRTGIARRRPLENSSPSCGISERMSDDGARMWIICQRSSEAAPRRFSRRNSSPGCYVCPHHKSSPRTGQSQSTAVGGPAASAVARGGGSRRSQSNASGQDRRSPPHKGALPPPARSTDDGRESETPGSGGVNSRHGGGRRGLHWVPLASSSPLGLADHTQQPHSVCRTRTSAAAELH